MMRKIRANRLRMAVRHRDKQPAGIIHVSMTARSRIEAKSTRGFTPLVRTLVPTNGREASTRRTWEQSSPGLSPCGGTRRQIRCPRRLLWNLGVRAARPEGTEDARLTPPFTHPPIRPGCNFSLSASSRPAVSKGSFRDAIDTQPRRRKIGGGRALRANSFTWPRRFHMATAISHGRGDLQVARCHKSESACAHRRLLMADLVLSM